MRWFFYINYCNYLSFFFKAKRKKTSQSEKPSKKPKSGESSKPGGSSKGSGNGDDNMFQVGDALAVQLKVGWRNVMRQFCAVVPL